MAARVTLLTGSGLLWAAQPHAAAAPAPLSPWAVLVREDRIAWVGIPDQLPAEPDAGEAIDLHDALVTPGLINAHTHPIYAGDRSDEAAARLAGEPYASGGILRTVRATRAASDEELLDLARARLAAELSAGTTTLEGKSGYGLEADEELRHLRLLAQAGRGVGIRLVRTFLGAHAVPPGAASASAYARVVAEEMVPRVAAEAAAEFCDVFCDEGFFSVPDARLILAAAAASGLGTRIHAEQLAVTGAASLAVDLKATSADHLEHLDADGVRRLAGSSTVATLLPAPALVLRDRLPPARALLDAGATVALASDANAGTFAGWGQMPLVIGLGSTLLGMTAEEALDAATLGGAASVGRAADRGRIAAGYLADLVAWDADHPGAFALRLGAVRATDIWVGGRRLPTAGQATGSAGG